MAVNYVKGQILSSTLERDGIDISIANANVGINTTTPTVALDVNGNIRANNLSATGNINSGNILTGGLISATGNAIAGNILTGGLISATGNVNGGNLYISNNATILGNLDVQGNITFNDIDVIVTNDLYIQLANNRTDYANINGAGLNVGPILAPLTNWTYNTSANAWTTNVGVSVTANVTGGNLLTNGLISATGNISGANINVTGDVIPTANLTYNLGSPTAKWKDLYVGGSTIYLGNIELKSDSSNALIVTAEDGISGGTINSAVLSAYGNVIGGNILTGGYVTATGNAIAGNVLTGGYVTATGNITAGNILTDGYVTATGNVTASNILTSGYVTATGNITGANVNTNQVYNTTGLTVSTGSGNINLSPSGNVILNNNYINGLQLTPQQDQDAASKYYVDILASTGLAFHEAVVAATTTTTAATTGGIVTYTQPNGVSNGVGAYLQTTGSFDLIDTANVQTVGTRILVKNEANAVWNGVYGWANATTIVRTTDTDQYGPDSTEDLSLNDYFFVNSGNVNLGTSWVVSAPSGVITFGSSNIAFSQFSQSQVYTAGNGISIAGTVVSAKTDNNTTSFDGGGNIIVKAGANLTTPNIGAATGTSLSVTGNITGGNIVAGNIVLASAGNISAGNVNINNLANPVANSDAATKFYVDQTVGNVSSSLLGNIIQIGTPTDGSLTTNVAYPGWTTGTYVTDGLDDLNQVALNIAGNTYVGNVYITANVTSGPSPLSVAFTGHYIGNPTSYLWNFGDGTTSTLANPTHTYSNVLGGQFTVVYTAYNTNGTYSGNAALGAKGSTATSTNTNYITLYTPLPIPSFTTSPTTLDTGSSVTLTNTSQYATSYTINYGDGNTAVNPGNSWTTNSHTYINSANVDALRSITLTGVNQTAGNAPPYSATSAATNVKIYTEQSPAVTANVTTTINYLATSGGVVSFRNDTPGSPGNTASFGAQQLYNFQWGDGTANSNVNIQTGLAGNPSAANLTHTFSLTSAQQNAATTINRVANLWLYTGYSTSPFKSSNVTISIEPEVRANFTGTSNTQTDATGYSSNAQVGYLYTDYNGLDRSLFNFRNDTSPNVAFTGNVFNWTWGDTTSNTGLSTFGNITHSYQSAVGSPTTGSKTVTLQANGTPGTISQSNTQTKTGYITILANPTAPTNLSGFSNVTIANASQFTNPPLLAAGANDNTGGNIVANGTSVTRFATTTPIATGANIINANTAITGTLTAYVNNTAAGNVTFTTGGNTVGTVGALVISADRDLHVANAAVPTGFYKVFSANISNTLASLGTGYNNYKFSHTVSGNTNYAGFVKDNLNSAPTLVTSNVVMAGNVSGTYTYISGIPYYSATGNPSVTVSTLELQNFVGQTFCSADPFTLAAGSAIEGTGSIFATQTKTLAQIDGPTTMLNGSNVKANIGITSNYTMGNLNVLINGAVNAVANVTANIFNVVGTSTTVQLPTKIQVNAAANTGISEGNIAVSATLGSVYTDNALRITGFGAASNTPAFSGSTNYYTGNVWS